MGRADAESACSPSVLEGQTDWTLKAKINRKVYFILTVAVYYSANAGLVLSGFGCSSGV